MREHSALRLVRAVAVLDGLDVVPSPAGVAMNGVDADTSIPWPVVEDLLGHDDPLDRAPRLRLGVLARLHRRLAALDDATAELARAARLLALPAGHPLVPGPGWVREEVPGGLLVLGIGVSGPLAVGDGVLPLPPATASAWGFGDADDWAAVRAYGERAGRAAGEARPDLLDAPGPLRGPRDLDALTMLALPSVRARLRGPVAAPARDRVWVGAQAMDAARLRAVWTLTPPTHRGVPGPMLADADRLVPVPVVRPRAPGPGRPLSAARRAAARPTP